MLYFSIVIALAVVSYLLAPYFNSHTQGQYYLHSKQDAVDTSRSTYENILNQIAELKHDHLAGKISEEDYNKSKQELLAESDKVSSGKEHAREEHSS